MDCFLNWIQVGTWKSVRFQNEYYLVESDLFMDKKCKLIAVIQFDFR